MRLRGLTRHLTVANVAATAALVVAMTGTGYAAATITSANVANNSLTGKDFKLATITAPKLSPAARNAFKGDTGATGKTGLTGQVGHEGAKGPQGPPGDPAPTRMGWSSFDTGYVDTAVPGLNENRVDWYAWSWQPGCVAPDCNQNLARAANLVSLDGGAGSTAISLSSGAPAGGSGSGTGPVTTAWANSSLMAWANVTLMYRTEGDAAPINTRAQCWMEIDGVTAGPSVWVAALDQRELRTLFVVGNTQRGPGTYDAVVRCRDADATAGRTRWQVVRANLSMLANEQA